MARKILPGTNPDLCDAGALLYKMNYQANWEMVVWSIAAAS